MLPLPSLLTTRGHDWGELGWHLICQHYIGPTQIPGIIGESADIIARAGLTTQQVGNN